MINHDALKAGRTFEADFAGKHGLDQMPGSGNTPRYKLDVGQVEVIMSLKWTGDESIRLTAKDIREMLAGAGGPGSRDQLGVLVHRIEGAGEEVATMRVSDLFALLRGEIKLELRPSKLSEKMAAADPLAYMREGESE